MMHSSNRSASQLLHGNLQSEVEAESCLPGRGGQQGQGQAGARAKVQGMLTRRSRRPQCWRCPGRAAPACHPACSGFSAAGRQGPEHELGDGMDEPWKSRGGAVEGKGWLLQPPGGTQPGRVGTDLGKGLGDGHGFADVNQADEEGELHDIANMVQGQPPADGDWRHACSRGHRGALVMALVRGTVLAGRAQWQNGHNGSCGPSQATTRSMQSSCWLTPGNETDRLDKGGERVIWVDHLQQRS